MKHLILSLILLLFCRPSLAAEAEFNDHLQNAENLLAAEKVDHNSRILTIIVELRRAWIAVNDSDLNSPAYQKLRQLLTQTYRHHNMPELANWYKSASLEEIDRKIKEKYLEGKTYYLKDWQARMDEFRMITIWRPDSLKPRQQPTVFYYKPGDEKYGDAATLSNLEPGQTKAVDFDLSSFIYVGGPTFGSGNQIDW